MSKETFALGIAGIIIGIIFFIKTSSILPSLVPMIIGLALLFFGKDENKIEKRKDAKIR